MVHAQPVDKKASYADKWKEQKDVFYQQAKDCKQCHTVPLPDTTDAQLDFVVLAEYSIWKTQDKHAQAYAVLEGDRGQAIGKIIGKDVLKEEGGCLNCHAMNNLAKETADKTGDPMKGLDPKDGVSCGGCHGPSSKWKEPHAAEVWRKKKPAEKEELGLRDLRDPLKRAELCTSCHIGNVAERKVVTHAMFAAGHPPLPPMEISAFSRNLPQHWRDPQFVPYFQKSAADPALAENYHLQSMNFQRSRFALVGSVVSLRESMKLAHDQAEANKDASDWPSVALAHSDCYACHHELKNPSYRQARGFGYLPGVRTIPGRPLLRTWPVGFGAVGADFAGKADDLKKFADLLGGVATATNSRPYGNPGEVATATGKVVTWCDELLDSLNKPGLYNRDKAVQFMGKLCDAYSPRNAAGPTPDYETARQLASVLKAVYEEIVIDDLGKNPPEDKLRDAEKKVASVFGALDKSLDLQPFKKRKDRTEAILEMVSGIAMLGGAEGAAALKDFSAFSANVNAGDPRKLKGNKLLGALLLGISNDQFTKGLKEAKVIKVLQELSDTEEQDVLNAIKGYDPAAFKAELEKVRGALK
jgi:hypothetical protein